MLLFDNEFFEEYKRLAKLCSEMYSCQNGVSEYISQMEIESYRGQYSISSWDSDYKMLKHVRWIRNQIAHDAGAYQISEPNDLIFVKNFYKRILSGNDPLTLLMKSTEVKSNIVVQTKKIEINQIADPIKYHKTTSTENNYSGLIIILFFITFLAFVFLMLYFEL